MSTVKSVPLDDLSVGGPNDDRSRAGAKWIGEEEKRVGGEKKVGLGKKVVGGAQVKRFSSGWGENGD